MLLSPLGVLIFVDNFSGPGRAISSVRVSVCPDSSSSTRLPLDLDIWHASSTSNYLSSKVKITAQSSLSQEEKMSL